MTRSDVGFRSERGPVLLAIMLSNLLIAIDIAVLSTAVPTVVADIGGFEAFPWLFTTYLLAQAVTVPVYSKLADMFGRKPILLFGIGVFLLGSILCAIAPSMLFLIVFRAVQGLGAGAISPMVLTIPGDIYSIEERARVQGYLSSVWAIAAVTGPTVGGLFAQFVDWRWIFWINVPLCLGALWLVRRFLPATEGRGQGAFDLRGTLLSGIGFACLMWGLMALAEARVRTGPAVAALAAGALLVAAYVRHARRTAEPVLALDLLTLRSFRDAMAGGSVFRIAVGGVPFLLPVTLQQRDGYSPLEAGLFVLVPAVGGFAMKFFSGKILRRTGYRKGLFLHGALAAGCLAAAGWVPPREAMVVYAATLFGFGWARSLQMNAYGTLAYADVARPRLAAATSFFLAIQNLTVAMGVAAAALLLQGGAAAGTGDAAYSWVYLVLGAVALASAAMTLAMPPSAGRDLLQAKR